MAVLEAHEAHQNLVEELIAEVAAYNPAVDRDLLLRAFRFAAKAHAGQHRRSGQDFVLHPLGAARICAELHLDEQTIAAALLHDVVENTDSTIDDIRAEFGDDIARLVDHDGAHGDRADRVRLPHEVEDLRPRRREIREGANTVKS